MGKRGTVTLCFMSLMTNYLQDFEVHGRSNDGDKEKIISSVSKVLRHAYQTHNAEEIADRLELPDTFLLPSGMPMAHGKAARIATHQEIMDKGIVMIEGWTDAVGMYGNYAVSLTYYEEDGSDSHVLEKGRALDVWKKERETGKWRRLYALWSKLA